MPPADDRVDRRRLWDHPRPRGAALAALVGRNRAAVLGAIAHGCTTTELADRVGISLAAASQHASVLRNAGLNRVPRASAGPAWATVLAAVLGGVITLVLRTHAGALGTLFTASTIMPALLYAGTVLLYIFTSRRRGTQAAGGTQARPFGKMEIPVIAGAVIWLAYELIVLIGPAQFRDAQYYVLGSLGAGLVFYVVQLITEPRAMRTEPGQEP